jgi:broad specificity polyphosphatase/5'/3'-nucleotidase SurE
LSGTPATCINIALNHLFVDEEFDLVIGGPNFGRNISTYSTYERILFYLFIKSICIFRIFTLASGTVGAAM